MKLEGLEAFVSTAETGSISGAARRLGLAKSVVSERLAELERNVGACLIQRTTRKLTLTEDGDRFLLRAHRILSEAREATSEIAERSGTLVGALRLSAPVSFGILHLGPALYAFLAAHPGIDLTLELDDRFVDPAADGYDAVIRHGPISDSRLVARRLATSRRVLVASPAYLDRHGSPRSVADLAAHQGIIYSNRESDWRFEGPEGWTVVRPAKSLRVNNGLVMRGAALAGLGIALLPTFFVGEQIAARSLLPVEIPAEAEGAELFVCYPLTRSAPAKVAALIDWLRRSFGDPPYWSAVDPPPLAPSTGNG